jgi:hypothetical protein
MDEIATTPRTRPEPCNGPGLDCTVASHQHDTLIDHEGRTLTEPVELTCGDDGKPLFYDAELEQYFHVDRHVGCWLFQAWDAK